MLNASAEVRLPPKMEVDHRNQWGGCSCVIHALDAFFNALVVSLLHKVWRFRDIVAIRDAWLVPASIDVIAIEDDDTQLERLARGLNISWAELANVSFNGTATLTAAIDCMGELCLKGGPRYSMIWSARSSSDCGIVRPSAFAVFRLITSSAS